jgi:hypothetical protein
MCQKYLIRRISQFVNTFTSTDKLSYFFACLAYLSISLASNDLTSQREVSKTISIINRIILQIQIDY